MSETQPMPTKQQTSTTSRQTRPKKKQLRAVGLKQNDFFREMFNQFKRYEPDDWVSDHQPSSTKAIQELQNAVKADVEGLKEIISRKILNLPDHGKPLDQLADRFAKGDKQLYEEIKSVERAARPEGVTSSEAGIPYAETLALKKRIFTAENDLIEEKFGFQPIRENLEKVITKLPSLKGISHHNLRGLLLLDDPPEWLNKGVEAMHRNKIFTRTSAFDSGVYTELKQTNGANMNAAQMYNQVSPVMKMPKFKLGFVDMATVRSVFYPEKNSAVHTDLYNYLPAGTVKTSNTVSLPSGNANLIVFFLPDAQDSSPNILTIGSYTPITGAWAPISSVPNPLTGSTSIQTAIVVSACIKFKSTVASSLNGTGIVYMTTDPLKFNTVSLVNMFPTTGSANTQLVNWENLPLSQSDTITTPEMRQVSPLYNIRDKAVPYDLVNPATYYSCPTVIILEGLNAAISPGVIEYNIEWNVALSSGLLATVPTNPAICGFTQQFIQALAVTMPFIYQCSSKWIAGFLAHLDTVEPYYEELLYAAEAYASCNPYTVPYSSGGGGGMNDVQEISFTKCE